MRRPWIWWLAVLAVVWTVFALCAYWEPVVGDGWGHVDWHRNVDVAFGPLWDELVWGYKYNNPRPGQIFTLLAYTPGPWHALLTPPALIGLFVLLAALVLGRWPSPRRFDDLFLFVAIVGFVGVCARQFGPLLFYRPITGNYTHAFAVNLLFLVPYRFHVAAPRPPRLWLVPAMLVLGFLAGFCNEHTGPAIAGAAAVATFASHRRGDARLWMLAGLAGFCAGFAVLLLAPGQSLRYEGLAEHASMLGRIADRGVAGNLRAIGIPVLAMWPGLAAVALGLAARGPRLSREQRITLVALVVTGLVAALTVLASPKIGHRLFFATSALWCAALAGWLVAKLTGRWRIAGAVLAGGLLAFVLGALVVVYSALGPVGAARMAALQAGPRGSTVTVERFPYSGGHWFLGDDFDSVDVRARIAFMYGLAAIELR